MENKTITQDQLRRVLREYIKEAGSQTVAAYRLGFSAAYLSDILAGRREISRQFAESLGYRRVVVFEQFVAQKGGASRPEGMP